MSLTSNEISRLEVLFAKASISDMNQIADMFNASRTMKQKQIKNQFTVGQSVRWFGKRGPMAGTITKINRKNIVVNAGQFGMWNVTPSLLEAV